MAWVRQVKAADWAKFSLASRSMVPEVEVGMRISSAEFLKNYETLSDKALAEPVTITRWP
jgi:hypothetical protein